MKTTSLPEILKQITPLPLKVAKGDNGGKTNKLLFSGSKVVADCENHMMEPATQEANAAYLTHAANVLPGLVKRMEKAENLLRRASEDLRAARMTGTPCYLEIEADEIRHALTLATSVPVNS